MSSNSEKSLICPTCKELGDVHKIIYGLPASGFDFEKYESGGCSILFGADPNWKCRNCGWVGLDKPRSKVI